MWSVGHDLHDMSAIRILFLGDVVGEPGRSAVIAQLPVLKQTEGLDFIIVNPAPAAWCWKPRKAASR